MTLVGGSWHHVKAASFDDPALMRGFLIEFQRSLFRFDPTQGRLGGELVDRGGHSPIRGLTNGLHHNDTSALLNGYGWSHDILGGSHKNSYIKD
jgi:hypothetical protein